MKTSDPDAYDQIVDLATYTSTSSTFGAFRALMLTYTTAGAVTFNVQQLIGGTLTSSKPIVVNLPSTGGTFILPLSGETVYISSLTSGAKAYALI